MFSKFSLLKQPFAHLWRRQMSSMQWKTTAPDLHFSVNSLNGFLPTTPPVRELPLELRAVDSLLQRMPVRKRDGSPGLLADGKFGDAVLKELPVFDVSGINDPALVAALFRDYCYLASAYLLEPSHLVMMEKKSVYGEGRDHIPASIAVPLTELTRKVKYSFPFLDYAHGYSLNNWYMVDERKGMTFDNLRCIRLFEGSSDEEGFILIHVAMVAHTGKQVAAQTKAIEAAAKKDMTGLEQALRDHAQFLKDIYEIFVQMWVSSSPRGYLGFRTFIMGITGNDSIFPRGVIYQGVDEKPRFYRGETGAQDSIMPASDNFLQMLYPQNKLTEYLVDLRQYRPKDHRAYLEWVRHSSEEAQVKQLAMSKASSSLALLMSLDVVQKIRSQHWNMTKSYIIKNTKHPKATGGTPITTWLPNQLGATLEYMEEVCANIDNLQANGDELTADDLEIYQEIQSNLQAKIKFLRTEVEALQSEFKNQDAEEFSKRNHEVSA